MKKILLRLKKGDEEAFDIVFSKYYRKIYYFCCKYFYSNEDSEEIVQEIFVKVWLNRKAIDLEKDFEKYIYTIAKNYILNDIRNRISNRARLLEFHKSNNLSNNAVEEEVFYHELEDILDQLIKNLPSRRKEIFILSRIKGVSNKEIAERLNISIKTVETQIKLALDYLKKVFESKAV